MNRKILIAAAAIAAISIKPASAQVVIQMGAITCQQFIDADLERKALVASWLGGYYSASKNLNVYESRYAKRNAAVAMKYCKKHKQETVLDAVMKTAH
jgi:acid stress chaperone HdeB